MKQMSKSIKRKKTLIIPISFFDIPINIYPLLYLKIVLQTFKGFNVEDCSI